MSKNARLSFRKILHWVKVHLFKIRDYKIYFAIFVGDGLYEMQNNVSHLEFREIQNNPNIVQNNPKYIEKPRTCEII